MTSRGGSGAWRVAESSFLPLCLLGDSALSSLLSPSLQGHGQSMDRQTGRQTDRQGWRNDGRMERGASEAEAAEKPETGSGSGTGSLLLHHQDLNRERGEENKHYYCIYTTGEPTFICDANSNDVMIKKLQLINKSASSDRAGLPYTILLDRGFMSTLIIRS